VAGHYLFGVNEKSGAEIMPADDNTRYAVTEEVGEEFAFSALPLRKIAVTAPYSRFRLLWELKVTVQIMADSQLSAELSQEDVPDFIAFYGALKGEVSEFTYPEFFVDKAAK
jgi:cytochrome c peroxidase